MEERFLRGGAVQPEAEPRRRHPRTEFLLAGLRRFVLITAGAAALSAGLGLVAGWLTNSDLVRYLTLGLYVGGAILVAYGVFVFSSAPRRWVGELGEDLGASTGQDTAGFIAVGIAVIGIAILVDWLAA
jgi:hypothetical protein